MNYITVTPELEQDLFEEFKSYIKSTRFTGATVNFSKTVKPSGPKAKVFMTPIAYQKMISLVNHCAGEVGWHGIVNRIGENAYQIEDIMVYPQVVTGTTVTPDQIKYQEWLYTYADDKWDFTRDEDFNRIRFQGHSHVNMGVTPSGTDNTLYRSILDGLSENDFYIFLITNKKKEVNFMIYDLAANLKYDNSDVVFFVGEDHSDVVDTFIKEADEVIEKFTATTTTATGGAGKGSGSSYPSVYGSGYAGAGYSGKHYGSYGSYYGNNYYGGGAFSKNDEDDVLEDDSPLPTNRSRTLLYGKN